MVSPFVTIQRQPRTARTPCPFCGFLTLDERGSYEISPVCSWEDYA
ncbi:CPCC family cysteine-rich protein [Streptomyces sp. AK04-3B]